MRREGKDFARLLTRDAKRFQTKTGLEKGINKGYNVTLIRDGSGRERDYVLRNKRTMNDGCDERERE